MGVTGFTFVLLPLCLLWFMAPQKLLHMMLIAGVFEAGAALVLGGIGLQPGMVPAFAFLGFMGLQILLGARFPGEAQVLAFTRPFVLVTLWALASSLLLPRLFEGTVFVWPEKAEPPFVLTALEPTSSNINQDVYLLVNCLLVVAAALFLTKPNVALRPLMRTYLISGFVVAFIAVWQFANKMLHVPYPDGLLYSNPGWSILTAQQIGNIPRINGPFSEPSSLGGFMGGIVCASGWQLLQGHRDRILGWAFIIGLIVMLMSTSTTGFGVLVIAFCGIVAYAVLSGHTRMLSQIMKIGLPLMLLVGLVYVAASVFVPTFNKAIGDIISVTTTKQQSDSYEGRTSTDIDSIRVAFETYGLGAGWGSNRSSSLVPGILSAIGFPGLIGLLWFGASIGRRVRRARRSGCPRDDLFVIDGCCGGLTGLLLAAILSGPTISSVTFFFLLALLIACVVRVEMQLRATTARLPATLPMAGRYTLATQHAYSDR